MSISLCAGLLALSLGASAFAEFLTWHLSYRREEYQELVKEVKRKKHKLELEKEAAQKTTAKKKSNAVTAKLNVFHHQLQLAVADVAKYALKAQLAHAGFLLFMSLILMRVLKGVVAARLPFNPIWLLKLMAHQGLTDPEPTDCSALCFYFLSLTITRVIVKRWFPQAPEIPSFWELSKLKND